MTIQLPVSGLAARWADRRPHLISRISFEERSLAVAKALANSEIRRTAFASTHRSDVAEKHLSQFRAAHPNAIVHELDTSKPLDTAATLYRVLEAEAKSTGFKDVIIDVSSFRREELLMLVAIVRLLKVKRGAGGEIIYVGATKMADWMSGQVTGFRSVIGYGGEMWPSRPTRLVVLMGFEFARARSIIDNYEPKALVLGKGSVAESITSDLAERNVEFYENLRSMYDEVKVQFEFSARDPLQTAQQLEDAVLLDNQSNVVIAPLHTKLSTIGAGIFAQRHKQVQICYAPVEAYNEQAYSTPGQDAYSLPLDDLL